MIKLLILILLFISPSWSFWCYNCQACNPDDNSAYKYCSGPYCELSFREGQRDKARQRCAEYAFKLGCTESWEGGKKMTTCYCNEKGCNDANVSRIHYPILIVTSILMMFLV